MDRLPSAPGGPPQRRGGARLPALSRRRPDWQCQFVVILQALPMAEGGSLGALCDACLCGGHRGASRNQGACRRPGGWFRKLANSELSPWPCLLCPKYLSRSYGTCRSRESPPSALGILKLSLGQLTPARMPGRLRGG